MAELSTPSWHTLISCYGKRPSLPLLIGGLREYTDDLDHAMDDLDCVNILLERMVEYRLSGEGPLVVYLEWCGQIEAPVFYIDAPVSSLYGGFIRILSPKTAEVRLYVSTAIEPTADIPLPEFADNLYHGFGHPDALSLRHYSRDSTRKEWQTLDAEDHDRIAHALGRSRRSDVV